MSMKIFNSELKAEILPGADRSIILCSAIRNSGLLAFLSPEDFQTLIAVLTFADASGNCSLSARIIGQSLNLSENQARKRLNKLCDIRWRGRPLIVKETRREDGRFVITIYRMMKVDGIRLVSKGPSKSDAGAGRSDGDVSGHDGLKGMKAVEETEAIPLEEGKVVRLEYPSEDTHAGCNNNINKHTTMKHKITPESMDNVNRLLVRAGVSRFMASRLARDYSAKRILRQLRMLPFRNAREPAAMLVKAIREDWSAPSAYTARLREMSIVHKLKDDEQQDKAIQDALSQRIESVMSKLSPAELRDIRTRAHEMVKTALRGAMRGTAPQSLVDAQVKKIINDEYLPSFEKA